MLENQGGEATGAFFDLCAGSGQMGLEALSRGYHPVHMCELDTRRFSHLSRELQKGGYDVVLHRKDFRRMSLPILSHTRASVFLDAPYSFWSGESCPNIDAFLIRLVNDWPEGSCERLLLAIQGPAPYSPPSVLPDMSPEVRSYRGNVLTWMDLHVSR